MAFVLTRDGLETRRWPEVYESNSKVPTSGNSSPSRPPAASPVVVTARYVDRVLGIGGLGLAALSFVLLPFRIEIEGDPETLTSILSISMLAWLAAITIRHQRAYPRGPGTGYLTGAWAVLGVFAVFTLFQATGTAAFDDGLLDGTSELLSGPPRLLLILPLMLSSIAILQDLSHRDR